MFITVRKQSCGKVMFLHLSVILFTEVGVYPSMHWARRVCVSQYALGGGVYHPSGQTPPRPLQRRVHVILECILVIILNLHKYNL